MYIIHYYVFSIIKIDCLIYILATEECQHEDNLYMNGDTRMEDCNTWYKDLARILTISLILNTICYLLNFICKLQLCLSILVNVPTENGAAPE